MVQNQIYNLMLLVNAYKEHTVTWIIKNESFVCVQLMCSEYTMRAIRGSSGCLVTTSALLKGFYDAHPFDPFHIFFSVALNTPSLVRCLWIHGNYMQVPWLPQTSFRDIAIKHPLTIFNVANIEDSDNLVSEYYMHGNSCYRNEPM